MPRKKSQKTTQDTSQNNDKDDYILVHVRMKKETYKRYYDHGFSMRPMKKVQTLAAECLETSAPKV